MGAALADPPSYAASVVELLMDYEFRVCELAVKRAKQDGDSYPGIPQLKAFLDEAKEHQAAEVVRAREPVTKANFEKLALAYGRANKSWVALKRSSGEWQEWQQYFERHLGWKHYFGLSCSDLTVPALVPALFDPTFTYDSGWINTRRDVVNSKIDGHELSDFEIVEGMVHRLNHNADLPECVTERGRRLREQAIAQFLAQPQPWNPYQLHAFYRTRNLGLIPMSTPRPGSLKDAEVKMSELGRKADRAYAEHLKEIEGDLNSFWDGV